MERWLADLGYPQYARAFADNDVDAATLPLLTSEDLREIGVASVGHRRLILRAAERLRRGDAHPHSGFAEAPAPAPTPAPAPAPERLIERRNLSVMFCDLVDFTKLSNAVDPEDLREHMARLRQVIVEAIEPYSGFIAQYLGDGVLVYFGYPRSHEYDAENAVSAALDIIASVRAMAPFGAHEPRVRIGIATGLTVVGRFEVSDDEVGESAVGRTVNLAARLQGLASPNGVVVSAATRRLIGDLFTCESRGRFDLKGFDRPAEVWDVVGRATSADRFNALRAGRRISPFNGRRAEVAHLVRRYEAAVGGEGRIVTIVGEGGVGKSRLARRIAEYAGDAADAGAVLQCAPNSGGSALHPFRSYLARLTAIDEADDADAARDKIAHALAAAGPVTAVGVALIAEFLRRGDIDASPLAPLSAQERRRRLMALLRDLTLAMARSTTVLIFDDVQWADPSTQELMKTLSPAISAMPLLVLATSRPTEDPSWLSGPMVETMELTRLDEASSRDLMRAIAGDAALPAKAEQAILARSDGVPVFIEELTRGYLEAAADGGDADDRLAGVPETLAESLLSRLDRLAHGRRLALVAAVIGNQFPLSVLIAISGVDETTARRGVEELLNARILETGRGQFGETLAFRHLLLRDAAYELLLRRERVSLHRDIARYLTDAEPSIGEAIPHIVAMQLEQGEALEEAAAQWDYAGDQAVRRSAYEEATSFFQRALAVTARLAPSKARDEKELTFRLNLTSCLVAARGYADPDAVAEMEKAVAISHAAGRRDNLIPALTAKWVTVGAQDQSIRRQLAVQIYEAARGGSDIDLLFANRVMATTHVFGGEFVEALAHIDRFFEIYDEATHERALAVVGPSNHALTMKFGLAEVYTIRNQLALADQWTERVFERAARLGAIHNTCHAIAFIGCLLPALRDQNDVLTENARRISRLSAEHDLPFWRGHAKLFHGVATARSGDPAAGFAEAREGIRDLVAANAFSICWFLIYADACEEFGHTDEAAETLDMVRPFQDRGERWMEAEFHRIEALILMRREGLTARADAAMKRALDVASRQGATLFLNRARADFSAAMTPGGVADNA